MIWRALAWIYTNQPALVTNTEPQEVEENASNERYKQHVTYHNDTVFISDRLRVIVNSSCVIIILFTNPSA